MEPNLPTLTKETEKFVQACEDIHALLASGPLSVEDRNVILMTANDLMTELKA